MAADEIGILDRDPDHLLSAELRKRALEIALGQAPLPLEPGNIRWGPVEKYQLVIGLKPPHDYCVGFIYWCYEEAKNQLNKEKKLDVFKNPLPKLGEVSSLYREARKPPIHIVDAPAQPGDIFLRKPGTEDGHAGIIWRVQDAKRGIYDTIEGNTAVCWPKGIDCHKKYTHGVFTRTEQVLTNCFFARY
jgi:hypothetical protein